MQYSLEKITTLTKEYGCPLYIYDTSNIQEQIQKLQSTFTDYSLLYSLKCNNDSNVARFLIQNNVGIDAASAKEVMQAKELGCKKERLVYSTPGKSEADIAATIEHSFVVADSYTELMRIDNVCANLGIKAKVGLRINPNLSVAIDQEQSLTTALPNKFGVSEEELLAHKDVLQGLKHCELVGFHVYIRSQIISAQTLQKIFSHLEALAFFWGDTLGLNLEFVDFGGGFGISYAPHMPSLDLEPMQEHAKQIRTRLMKRWPNINLYIESGRFLVARAGTYVTEIMDIKESRGTTFVIAKGLLNGFFRPAIAGFAELVSAKSTLGHYEPLWSGSNMIPHALGKSVAAKEVHICGNLCTALDTVCRNVRLENIAIGNYLLFDNAGAYGAVLSPQQFSSHGLVSTVTI